MKAVEGSCGTHWAGFLKAIHSQPPSPLTLFTMEAGKLKFLICQLSPH